MSKRSDRAADRKAAKKAQKQAERDLRDARSAARKAFDLKDPRFLGEAAVAATRGPAGLALFGASRGLQVAREKRAENAGTLDSLRADAKQHADSLKEQTSDLAASTPGSVSVPTPEEVTEKGRKAKNKAKSEAKRAAKRTESAVKRESASGTGQRRGLRRFVPLWLVVLSGGAAVAGATAYFLREQGSAASSSTPSTPAPSGPTTTPPAGHDSAKGAETGEDLSVDTPDPEGPEDQPAGSAPAAESSAPGAAAGSAPQPTDEQPSDEDSSDNT